MGTSVGGLSGASEESDAATCRQSVRAQTLALPACTTSRSTLSSFAVDNNDNSVHVFLQSAKYRSSGLFLMIFNAPLPPGP